jgi:hypothetical protein
MIFFSNLIQATSHFVSRGVWLERGPSARRLHQRARLLLPQRLRQLPGMRCTLEARRVLNQLSIFFVGMLFFGCFSSSPGHGARNRSHRGRVGALGPPRHCTTQR